MLTTTPTVDHNGPAIRAMRQMKGLSCSDLADLVGIHEQSLRNIELYDSATRPERPKKCSVETLNRIARVLDIPVGAIVRSPLFPEGQDQEVAC